MPPSCLSIWSANMAAAARSSMLLFPPWQENWQNKTFTNKHQMQNEDINDKMITSVKSKTCWKTKEVGVSNFWLKGRLVSFAAVFRDVTQRGSVAWHPERRLRRRLKAGGPDKRTEWHLNPEHPWMPLPHLRDKSGLFGDCAQFIQHFRPAGDHYLPAKSKWLSFASSC